MILVLIASSILSADIRILLPSNLEHLGEENFPTNINIRYRGELWNYQ